MRRQIIILAAALVAVAAGLPAQQLRRPPVIEDCPDPDSTYCQMWPDACVCTTEERPFVQMAQAGPPLDPFAGGYTLPRLLAVTQVAHEDVPWRHPNLYKTTNLDFALEAFRHGFDAIKLWIEEQPFNCGGPFEWHTYWGQRMFTSGGDCVGEDMMRFWREVPQQVVIVRPQWYAWSSEETTDDGIKLTHCGADFYAVAKRLYETIGDRNLIVILTDWEQDHLYRYYDWHTLRLIEQRQADVERARREAYMERRSQPALRVYHAVIVNRFVPLGAEEGTTLTEQIPALEHRPDFIGISYWRNGDDPTPALEWVSETTGYPARRIYIDEFGGDVGQQEHRLGDYVPAFFDFGAKVCAIWLWKQGWCDPEHNRGLWLHGEPCENPPTFTEPSPGYEVLRRLRWQYQ